MELDFRGIERAFKDFKGIESTTSSQLSDKEYKILVNITRGVADVLQQINSIVSLTCSAISASSNPPNSSLTVTLIVDNVDKAKQYLKEVESQVSKFKTTFKFEQQKSIITDTHKFLGNSITEIRSAFNLLHKLLFG